MQVTEHDKTTLLMNRLDQSLRVPDSRMQGLVGHLPSSIKITTSQTASIVSVDHTIRIEHGDDLEDKVLSKHSRLFIVWISQKGENAAHHPRSYCLTRVHSRSDDHALALGKVLQILC